jgi:BirA family biotin operon repressor/biotin-[acetyl-CoA-carboxylase] ligase
MKTIALNNPFGAPVYHVESVSSTMEAARALARSGAAPGTIIASEFQEQGRGRQGRSWTAKKGESLLFTLLLRYPEPGAIPQALTLRTGLALALAIEAFAPSLRAELKWPNDIMLNGKKTAGILAEGDGGDVYVGIGVNVFQKEFPPELRGKATSIAQALDETPGRKTERKAVDEAAAGQDAAGGAESAGRETCLAAALETGPAGPPDRRFVLLEKILDALYHELKAPLSWRDRLEARLYMKGKPVRFAPGGPDSELLVEGILKGVGPGGELLIAPAGGAVKSFASGELRVYGTSAADNPFLLGYT